MPDSFQIEGFVPAPPERVWAAWMDAARHSAFTRGGEAVVEGWTGGRFTAFDGYVHGIYLGVDEHQRIVQTWRTADFPHEMRDSRVTIELSPLRNGTRLVIRHSDLPASFLERIQRGWREHYLEPLARWFAQRTRPQDKEPTAREKSATWGRASARAAARTGKPSHKKTSAVARKPAKAPARAKPARKAAARSAPTARRPAAKAARRAAKPARKPAARRPARSRSRK